MQHKAQYDALLDSIELPPPLRTEAPAASGTEPTSEGFEEEGLEGEGSASNEASSTAAPSVNSAEAPSAPASGKSSLYLTDEELLKMQKSSESGEVSE
jgi:hypothetical protein